MLKNTHRYMCLPLCVHAIEDQDGRKSIAVTNWFMSSVELINTARGR